MLEQLTDVELMRELGARLRAYRMQRNITAAVVAERARLSPATVLNAEAGKNPRLATIIRLLRILGRIEALESFLPPPTISPMDAIERGNRPRQRASAPRG